MTTFPIKTQKKSDDHHQEIICRKGLFLLFVLSTHGISVSGFQTVVSPSLLARHSVKPYSNEQHVSFTTSLHAKPKKSRSTNPSVLTPSIVSGDDDDDGNNEAIPANLRRKVVAKRTPLGHVVPRVARQKMAASAAASYGGSSAPVLKAQGKQNDNFNSPSNLKIVAGTARGRRLDSPSVYLRPMMGKVREAVFSTFTSFGLYEAGAVRGDDRFDPKMSRTRHLDIFAGSGSVGLESLSRGAAFCAFVDFSNDCCGTVQRNLRHCRFVPTNDDNSDSDTPTNNKYDRAQVVCADYLQALRNPVSVGLDPLLPFQLLTLCPPYEEVVYAELLQAVVESPIVTDDTLVMVEYPIELGSLPHVVSGFRRNNDGTSCDKDDPNAIMHTMVGIRNRKYGRTVIAMYVVNPTGKLDRAESRPEEFVSL